MKDGENNELKAFFKEMKAIDKHRDAPPFEFKKQSKRRFMLPAGVAAGLLILLLACIVFFNRRESTYQNEEVILVVSEGGPFETESLIQQQTSVEKWESPTASLIADF